jgi:hypothetical protein
MLGPLPWGRRVVLLLTLSACLLPLPFAGQRSVAHVPRSRFHDWTTHHAIYANMGTLGALEAARSDPRALFRWREVEQRELAQREIRHGQLRSYLEFRRRRGPGRFPVRRASHIHTDWSINLGAASTAPAMYPAKFSFDVNATPSCANDFIVYPVNVNGSATQPNIVAFHNLYSGTAGGTGLCNRATPVNDDGVSATVFWTYNVNAIGGAVTTSPVLSFDNTGGKVAFVESAAGQPTHFHVLAWKSGDGKDPTNAQNVLVPKPIIAFAATAPAVGSGAATDLALGATGTDTLSSPFVDYGRDQAYVGNDVGVLYRIKNVFCTTLGCAGAAPSLDTTWGVSGAVTVGCGAKLTGPVVDLVTLNVFVGCADGKVYGFKSTGAALATASIAVGDGSATGGIVESPMVDGVNGFIYAVSGTGAAPNTTRAVLVQASTSLGGPCAGGTLCVATVGVAGVHSIHAPAFNDPYFSSATSTTWLLYETAYSSAANLTLYAATFSATRTLTPGAAAHVFNFGTHLGEYSPLTEFNNAGTDQLFFGVLHSSAAALNLGNFPINTFPIAVPVGAGIGNGPSGTVVDNSSTSAQASSI